MSDTLDIVGNFRLGAASEFAREVAELLKDCREQDRYYLLREKAHEFIGKYESGLESLAREWQRIAHDALASTIQPARVTPV